MSPHPPPTQAPGSPVVPGWLNVALGLLMGGGFLLLWRLIRPGLTRLQFYFMRTDDGRALFRDFFDTTMHEHNVMITTTASGVRTLQERFGRFEERQDFHDTQIAEIHQNTKEIPLYVESAARIATAVEDLDKTMREAMERIASIEARHEERRLAEGGAEPRIRRRKTDR